MSKDERTEFHYSGQSNLEESVNAEKMNRIHKYMEDQGVDAAIVFTDNGMISFGNSAKMLMVWLHQKEHFEKDIMPLITKEMSKEMQDFIANVAKCDKKHF